MLFGHHDSFLARDGVERGPVVDRRLRCFR
jgi:hypothetical protein